MDTYDSNSTQDKAYDYLKHAIVSGAYNPNQRLKVLQIADKLNMSRTPVKEALGRLAQEGLVKRDLGSGYVVQGLTVQEILDLYRVREVLEVEAAREALPKLNSEVLQQMRETLDRADTWLEQRHFDEFLRVNRRFHNIMVDSTQNSVLRQILNGLDARFWSIGTVVVSRHTQRANDIRSENRAILEALESGDTKRVEKAIRAHVRGAANHVRLFIEREPHHLYLAAA